MSEQHLQLLRDNLGLDRDAAGEATASIIRGGLPLAADLPDWSEMRTATEPDGSPPRTELFLRPIDAGERDVVLRVDSYELPSASEAAEHLVKVLSDFQSPQLRRIERDDLGNAAVAHGDTAVVVRRGNIVFVVRNAGRDVIPVLDVAATIDGVLRRRADEGTGSAT